MSFSASSINEETPRQCYLQSALWPRIMHCRGSNPLAHAQCFDPKAPNLVIIGHLTAALQENNAKQGAITRKRSFSIRSTFSVPTELLQAMHVLI